MALIERILRMIEHITGAVYIFAATAICALFLLMFSDITGRFLFNVSITGTTDFSQYLLVAIAFLSLGYAQIKGAHVKVDTLISHFPEKLQISLNILTTLMAMTFFIIMAMQIGERAYLDWSNKLLLPISAVQLPVWWTSFMATVGCVLLVVSLLVQLVRIIFKLLDSYKQK